MWRSRAKGPKPSLGRRPSIVALAALLSCWLLCECRPAAAANVTWLTTGSNAWNNTGFWSGGTPPTSADVIVFSANNANTNPQLNSNYAVLGVLITNTGSTSFTSQTTQTRDFGIGASGITITSTAGAVTIGDPANTKNLRVVVNASQTWTNNSSNLFLVSGSVMTSSTAGVYSLTIDGSGSTAFTSAVPTAQLTNNGSGILALVKSGAGTLTLSNSNSYTGGTTINAGLVVLGNSFALGGATGPLAVNGGTLNLSGYSAAVGSLSGSAGGLITTSPAVGTTTLTVTASSGVSSVYGGSINDNGSGMIALVKAGAGLLNLSGTSNYSGGTTLTTGTLVVSNTGALGNAAGSLAVGGGVLDLGGLFHVRTGLVQITGGTITTGTISEDVGYFDVQAGTIAAGLAGAAGVTKSGAGSATLSGSSTYMGATTLSAGTLVLGNSFALGSSGTNPLLLNSGTLNLNGNSAVVGPLTGSAGTLITRSAVRPRSRSIPLARPPTPARSGAPAISGW